MKRILTMILALILVLSCCPNVFATEAEEELGYSEALANMDPKIKEIISSQMSQEERDELVALDPSLSDALLLKVFYFSELLYRDGYYEEKTIDAISSAVKQTNRGDCYYLPSRTPQMITFSKDADSGAVSVLKKYNQQVEPLLQRVITDLEPQVVINGKTADVTGIYILSDIGRLHNWSGGVAVYILTEAGSLFYLYPTPGDVMLGGIVLSESELQTYIDQYIWYSKIADAYANQHLGVLNSTFRDFVVHFHGRMADAKEMQTALRINKIKRALATYGPIVLVALVAGGGAAIYIICRKRKKKALATESAPNPEDVPTPTEPIPTPTEQVLDPTEQIPNTPDP